MTTFNKSIPEPFQVVWKDLAFVINASTYDTVVNKVLRPISKSFTSKKSQKQKEAEFNNKDIELFDGSQRIIFESLNGYFKSSEITAILGPSGAGKTSLLNALSGKKHNYNGTVQLIGGGKRRMQLSFIPQRDYLIENLTVEENLLYSSKILNTQEDFDHESNIMRVVKMLNLTHCFHSKTANISGGEYKRVSIAQELLRQPDILILDEPTSGLDSLNCKKLIKSLVQLKENSRLGYIKPIAIVMTIHQPDIEVYQMFDHVYCMARHGRVIYDGHPSDTMRIIGEQTKLTGLQNSNVISNPANLLIEIASEDLCAEETIEELARNQRQQFKTWLNLLQLPGDPIDKRLLPKKDHNGKFWHHTGLLTKRAFTATFRDPLMSLVSLIFHLTIPFVMYTVYSPRIGTARGCPLIERELDVVGFLHNSTSDKIYWLGDDVHTTFECSTMFFITKYCFSMCALSIAALAFPMNMHVLLKEVRNGWYNLSSFVLAKTISSFPFEVMFPVVSIVMIYLLLGFPSSYFQWRLLGIALVMAIISMYSYSQGLLFGAIFMDDLQTSIFMAICSTLPLVVMSGFTARISLMPKLLQWLSWTSVYRYSIDSINILRFGFGLCPCSEETNQYLQTQPSAFRDLPSNIKPLFNFYLTGLAREESSMRSLEKVHGVSYDFILDFNERNDTLNAIENNEVDVFEKLADSMSKAFSFGRELHDCTGVRAEILQKYGTPEDEFLPYLFGGLFGMLVFIKVVLFVVVRYKINSKI